MSKKKRFDYTWMIVFMSWFTVILWTVRYCNVYPIRWIWVFVPFWGPYALLAGAWMLTIAASIIFMPFAELEKREQESPADDWHNPGSRFPPCAD